MPRDRRQRQREPLSDRRSAFRFPVSGERSQGQLRWGDHEIDVEVVDESAGGFAVEFDGPTECRVGDQLMLGVADEWVPVRVMFLDMQDVGVERFTTCNLVSHTRLGLKRISEDARWPTANRTSQGFWARFRRPRINVRKQKLWIAAAVFCAGLIVVGGVFMHATRRSQTFDPIAREGSDARVANIRNPLAFGPKGAFSLKRKADAQMRAMNEHLPNLPVSGGAGRAVASSRTIESAAAKSLAPRKAVHAPLAPTISSSAAKIGRSKALAKVSKQASNLVEHALELSEATIRIAQPEALLSPEMVARLHLSPAQQLQLQRLATEVRTSDRTTKSSSEFDAAQLTLGRRSLNILTGEQRKLLEAWQATRPAEGSGGIDKPVE
jgi:hypothetical protein